MSINETLTTLIAAGNEMTGVWQPMLFRLNNESDKAAVEKLYAEGKIVRAIESTGTQVEEIENIKDPSKITHASAMGQTKTAHISAEEGVWVFYPWHATLIHIVDEADYATLRAARNEPLITKDEHAKILPLSIAFAGLNVGNPCAVCAALEGAGQNGLIKLADFDSLSVTNLNRFRAGLSDLETNKAFITARQIFEINPFANIEMYPKGIAPESVDAFLAGPKVDILVEEIDNLKLKIALREKARDLRIPVIMVTGDGENVILDIERYDLDPTTPMLNGYLSEETKNAIAAVVPGQGTFEERVMLARDFMGEKGELNDRLYGSFSAVGKTLAGIPQLAESSFCRGAVIAHAIRMIATKSESVASGRYRYVLSDVVTKNA
jgi:hypothetical protein